MARAGVERIGTPRFHTTFNQKFPDPGYQLATVNNVDKLKGAIEEDFGSLPEIHPPYHNYYDKTSPDFATFIVVAYNRDLGHALFRGSAGEKLHLAEYFLEDRERKAFSRRGLVFPCSEPNTPVSSVQITQVDGDFRKVYQFYFRGRRKPDVNVRFTHGGYSDYEGESLVEAGFSGNKLSTVDLLYRRQIEEAKPPAKVQETVAREYHPRVDTLQDFQEIVASRFPDPNETLQTEPPELMRFKLKLGSKIVLTAHDYVGYQEQTRRVGEAFNPNWIQPFIIVTSHVEERLRVRRIQRSGTLWDILVPMIIDNKLVTSTALDRELAWRDLNTVFPVTFNMSEAARELPQNSRESLPSNRSCSNP